MRRTVIAAMLAVFGTIAYERGRVFVRGGDDHQRFDQQAFVVSKIVDGDTVYVRSRDGSVDEKIRLIGIDAPEMNPTDPRPPDHWAEAATAYLRERSAGREVTLRLEPLEARDRYGRLLAYLYLGDDENLNLAMVRDGQAYADRRFRHTHRGQFEQAETEARKRGRGLWKDVQPDQMPEWRRKWMTDRE